LGVPISTIMQNFTPIGVIVAEISVTEKTDTKMQLKEKKVKVKEVDLL